MSTFHSSTAPHIRCFVNVKSNCARPWDLWTAGIHDWKNLSLASPRIASWGSSWSPVTTLCQAVVSGSWKAWNHTPLLCCPTSVTAYYWKTLSSSLFKSKHTPYVLFSQSAVFRVKSDQQLTLEWHFIGTSFHREIIHPLFCGNDQTSSGYWQQNQRPRE